MTVEEDKDIGVIVQANLKPAAQCATAARTAQAVLGQISCAFHYRDRHVFMKLYKQYVRPHLEFSTQAWALWSVEDKKKLENVQQRAVKMVSGLKAVDNEEKLKELGLLTLEERRVQADMQMVLDPGAWFEPVGEQRAIRSSADPWNIKRKHGKLETRAKFFSIRVIDTWNALPAYLKAIKNPEKFKAELKRLRATQMYLAYKRRHR